ncbi:MAG TPA: HNH endonuclease [Bradyrhizobium sp.]|jgi:5-methylcytosine-specific restriction endonuclease McrA|nr:HNH endonuclease [Bradyrhizobium sp.]
MISLPPPSAADDETYLADLCQNAGWSVHQGPWLLAYAAYRQHGGNPWAFNPRAFVPDVGDDQRALYDARRSARRLQRIRQTPGLLCCPMCGSPTTGGLDHYLPRSAYPEFSIMAANLVPACTHCNSGVKGNICRGISPERFIHPYFDAFANMPLWQVAFAPPYLAVTFCAVPAPGLNAEQRSRVAFHLAHVLGSQFLLWAQNQWATFPQLVRNTIGGAGTVTTAHVATEARTRLRDAVATTGMNSWLSAFFRGLQEDMLAHVFIATATQPFMATPIA